MDIGFLLVKTRNNADRRKLSGRYEALKSARVQIRGGGGSKATPCVNQAELADTP
jgi:hypothetical protein